MSGGADAGKLENSRQFDQPEEAAWQSGRVGERHQSIVGDIGFNRRPREEIGWSLHDIGFPNRQARDIEQELAGGNSRGDQCYRGAAAHGDHDRIGWRPAVRISGRCRQ